MTMQTTDATPPPSAQIVGNAFVEQYYLILHQSPELVFRFYQDSSVLSRPGQDGVMTSVTTMQGINEKILSFGYKNYKAEIVTADSQYSYKDGVVVFVTGSLTGKDDVRRKFAQSFFLAPQDKGFFVLNDVFRYVDENEPLSVDSVVVEDVNEEASAVPLTPDRAASPEKNAENGERICETVNKEDGTISEKEVAAEPPVNPSPVSVSASLNVEGDTPKKSYASIVRNMKENTTTSPVYVRTSTAKVAHAKTEEQQAKTEEQHSPVTSTATLVASAPLSNGAPQSSNDYEDVKGRSIYISNLPLNVTAEQVERIFKKFGPVKDGGVQVRSFKQQGHCFGFVEFESSSSVHGAIEASPITIGVHQATVEHKKTSGNGRGRFLPARGGFRNDGFRSDNFRNDSYRSDFRNDSFRSDNFRGRGNFVGGRGYGRNEFVIRGEFAGRARGSAGRNGETYQRVYQNGNGRVGGQGEMKQTAAAYS
ncbi:nuclear transport factor 2-like [Malania oleifera]|uniref:nuclear transport factor 2-like n=1 Tax=Malania oleifera TaxID=397392 RepID=UPI0025AE2CFB|nr:nuclear transport factor 2-like [Malania oleifera]